jgi:hypothetical protein
LETNEADEVVQFAPIIPLWYNKTTQNTSSSNLFLIFNWEKEDGNLSSLLLFPFYYQIESPRTESEKRFFHIIPVHFSQKTKETSTNFTLGLYRIAETKFQPDGYQAKEAMSDGAVSGD